jgi:hypothetical protein
MMHWHGWDRQMITREAERVRLQTGDVLCKDKAGNWLRCLINPRMAARVAAIGISRKASSYYNAAKEPK